MIGPETWSQLHLQGTGASVCEVQTLRACLHVLQYFAHQSVFAVVCGYCQALSGMCRSVCKCLLLKQTRHLSPTGP